MELDTTKPDGRSPWQRPDGDGASEPFLLQARSVMLMRDAAG